MNYKLLFVLVLFPLFVQGQKRVLHEETDTSGVAPMFGPNRSVYVHGLSKYGFILPVYEDGAGTEWWSSVYSFEMRTKAKICSWNALILDMGYRCDRFVLRQDMSKLLPVLPQSHKRERLSMHNVTFALCDRINFGRRGDVLGTYFDFGFYGDYVFRSAQLYVDELTNPLYPSDIMKTRTKSVGLDYINRLNYGLTARFGFEYFSLFGMYRISDLVADDPPMAYYPDLPRLVVGIEVYGRE